MKRRCAWCGADLSAGVVAATPDEQQQATSHGMCQACADSLALPAEPAGEHHTQREDQFALSDPGTTRRELMLLCRDVDRHADYAILADAFRFVVDLFQGRVPGYRACNTRYHDLSHTLGVTLASARLVHAAHITTGFFDAKAMTAAVVAALFHDTGFIPRADDWHGTGAKYGRGHEERSVQFLQNYLWPLALQPSWLEQCSLIVRSTAVAADPDRLPFSTREHRLLGKIVGAADLLSQVADPLYLEKLPYLYEELNEARRTRAASLGQFLTHTEQHYRTVYRTRMEDHFDHVGNLMRSHCKERYGVNRDLYYNYVLKNIRYLRHLVREEPTRLHSRLRRTLPATAAA